MSSLLVFNRVYRLEIQSVMLVFSTHLVNCCPSTFSLTSPNPPPFPKSTYIIYRQCVAVGGEGVEGVLSCVVNHILQEFSTLFLTRFRTYKIASPPQTKHQLRRHSGIGVFIVPSPMVWSMREGGGRYAESRSRRAIYLMYTLSGHMYSKPHFPLQQSLSHLLRIYTLQKISMEYQRLAFTSKTFPRYKKLHLFSLCSVKIVEKAA